ncbi:toll/interleukin-1 receptor domain-containing protein [Allocoleopsis franciscana]|uniref:TIR domain-containing protein n=1 Tax=Allocoleopsis franciscana PCC 7113 TaxID=1173027 RepID=K9WR49_9CYAN|nr:toll/interleukin-1 receptor domain-containing protein [Allocoleopsis franciscana]AFZ22259.1 TIR domain-containing protein [Allocoleopsis franciscana PCC 7113]
MSDQLSSFNPKANLYISYPSQDQVLLDEFLKLLTALPWENITISSYHEGQIAELAQTEDIESRLSAADVVVMIVSSTYLDSVNRRRWELDEIAGKSIVIAINVSPVSLKASRLKGFCSSWVDDSPVTSWSGQVEKLKIAAGAIYEAAAAIGSESNVSDDQSNSEINDDLASDDSYATRGLELRVQRSSVLPVSPIPFNSTHQEQPDSDKPDVAQFQQKLEQVYRIQEPPSPSTLTNKDLVDCSVFSPPAVAGGDTFLVQVFVHLPEQAEMAKQQAQEFDSEAKQLGIRSLGLPIERGTALTFSLSIPNLEVDEPNQQLVWKGRAESVQFGVTVPADLTQKTVIGTITVSQNSIPLGHLKFKLSITPAAATTAKEPQPVGDAARVYKKAFVSYSSKDRKEVLKRVQGLAVTGIEVFQDILDLEPGDRWERELYRNIDECDLFLLFWSTAAKESKWVLKEALYALERQGKDELNPPEIIPVIIEGPPAVSPPDELQHLHFNDKLLYLIALSN